MLPKEDPLEKADSKRSAERPTELFNLSNSSFHGKSDLVVISEHGKMQEDPLVTEESAQSVRKFQTQGLKSQNH